MYVYIYILLEKVHIYTCMQIFAVLNLQYLSKIEIAYIHVNCIHTRKLHTYTYVLIFETFHTHTDKYLCTKSESILKFQVSAGVDIVMLETFQYLSEIKIALDIVKELFEGPIVASMAFSDEPEAMNHYGPGKVLCLCVHTCLHVCMYAC
jgi:methionine synthase I (cobalamin-dependent)